MEYTCIPIEDAYLVVNLPSVSLPRHRQPLAEAHAIADQSIQLFHFLVIAVEKFQESRLRAGGSYWQSKNHASKVFQMLLARVLDLDSSDL